MDNERMKKKRIVPGMNVDQPISCMIFIGIWSGDASDGGGGGGGVLGQYSSKYKKKKKNRKWKEKKIQRMRNELQQHSEIEFRKKKFCFFSIFFFCWKKTE